MFCELNKNCKNTIFGVISVSFTTQGANLRINVIRNSPDLLTNKTIINLLKLPYFLGTVRILIRTKSFERVRHPFRDFAVFKYPLGGITVPP